MTSDPTWIDASETVDKAAQQLAKEDIGALPICQDGKLTGVITDRDIVVKVIAKGQDPTTVKVGDLAQGEAVTIGADDSIDELVKTMREHDVRRLPVIDGTDLVGVVAQADVAVELGDRAGELVADISASSSNN